MGYTNTWGTQYDDTIQIHMGYTNTWGTQYDDTIQIHMGYTNTWGTLSMTTHNTNTHGIHKHMGCS